ncbi:MAG: hypothetical protein O7D91_15755 [Planctomycetota bacterium]|nr:hypothetical protein [Planctomycetota bacterium]
MLTRQHLCSLFTPTAFILLAMGANLALPDSAHAQWWYLPYVIQAPECPPPFPPAITSVEGLSESGRVGYYHHCGESEGFEAFIWTSESGLVTLTTPPGVQSAQAFDINDAGQIAGTMGGFVSPLRGFFYDGDYVPLDPPPGGSFSDARAINNSGQVVGTADNPKTSSAEAFLWEAGTMTILGPMPIPGSAASDINEAAVVVGHMGDTSHQNPTARGFIWEEGNVTVLDPIPGGVTSVATAINNVGQVVGWGLVPSEDSPSGFVDHAFLWTDGVMTDLGTLPGRDRSWATDIKDSGQVIGMCALSGQDRDKPFLWDDGVMCNVNSFVSIFWGLNITFVSAINSHSTIVGRGADSSGAVGVLLGRVIPEWPACGECCNARARDLAMILGYWGLCEDPCEPGPPETTCLTDLSGDCNTGPFDLAIVLGSWE